VAALLLTRSAGGGTPRSPFAAAGPPRGDIRAAAGGGGGMQQVDIRVQRTPPVEAVPIPVPVPDAPVVEEPEQPDVKVEPTPIPGPDVAIASPGTGQTGEGGSGGTSVGPGTATGTGQGGGGTEETGGSGMIAPSPRGLILPPSDRPASVRGREVTVWVFVSERGRVLADSTRLEPPTPDNRYNRRLMQCAAEWSFEPGRKAGRPVGAWYPFQVIL
jgi:hypothetical protein